MLSFCLNTGKTGPAAVVQVEGRSTVEDRHYDFGAKPPRYHDRVTNLFKGNAASFSSTSCRNKTFKLFRYFKRSVKQNDTEAEKTIKNPKQLQ